MEFRRIIYNINYKQYFDMQLKRVVLIRQAVLLNKTFKHTDSERQRDVQTHFSISRFSSSILNMLKTSVGYENFHSNSPLHDKNFMKIDWMVFPQYIIGKMAKKNTVMDGPTTTTTTTTIKW